MSTILKALKQVDQTTPPDDLQSWPPEVDTKKTVKARVEKIRPQRKVYLAIALVVIIAAAGLFVYNQKDLLLARLSPGRVLEKDKLTSSASSKKGLVHQAQIKPSASKQTARSAKTDPPPTMGNQPASDTSRSGFVSFGNSNQKPLFLMLLTNAFDSLIFSFHKKIPLDVSYNI